MAGRQGRHGGDAARGPGYMQVDRQDDLVTGRTGDVGRDDLVGVGELRSLEQRDDEVSRSAERLAQLDAEKELVDELAKEQFEGPGWRRYAEVLAHYGRAVVFAWLVTGEMFTQATARGRGVGPKPANFCRDDCEELAQEVVVRGLRHFQRYALKERRWDPTKGATMKTYFIGSCIGEFSNSYRHWKRARGNDDVPTDPHLLTERDARYAVNPYDELAHAEAITSTIENLDSTDQKIIWLYRSGYSHEEVARILGLKNKEAVAERIRRILRRIADARKTHDEAIEGA